MRMNQSCKAENRSCQGEDEAIKIQKGLLRWKVFNDMNCLQSGSPFQKLLSPQRTLPSGLTPGLDKSLWTKDLIRSLMLPPGFRFGHLDLISASIWCLRKRKLEKRKWPKAEALG